MFHTEMKGGNGKLAERKQSRIYKTLPKYMKQKARRVNKLLNMWNNAGLTSNDLELVKDMLSDFYDNIGKTVKESQLASENIKLKRSEKEEYNKILDFILYNDEIDWNKRTLQNQKIRESWNEVNKSTYEKIKSQYDQVYDEQSFIDFVDNMNKMKNNRVLKILMDSDQYAEIYGMAEKNKIKESEVNKWLISMYEGTGATYDELYGKMQRIIKRVGKNRKGKK